MDSQNQQHYYQPSPRVTPVSRPDGLGGRVVLPTAAANLPSEPSDSYLRVPAADRIVPELPPPPALDGADAETILSYIQRGHLWAVNSRRRNGLILYKHYHAEFAGPGAAVGGYFDQDCQCVIPVGNLSLLQPATHEERQNAYLIRRQWIKLTQQFTDQSSPKERAQMILNQFETYFDQETIARIPDHAFAMLVGVLPYSIRKARRVPGKLNLKIRS